MKRCKRSGFSLIEVLVSILVLALGVIGAAAMQLTALRTTQQSALQSTALQLASEMADKIRANDSQMAQPDLNNLFLAVDYRAAADAAPDPPAKLCYANACNGEELARFAIYEWEQRIRSELPGGRARICRDATPWDSAKGALSWACSDGAGTDGSLVIKLGWQARNLDGDQAGVTDRKFAPMIALTVAPYIK